MIESVYCGTNPENKLVLMQCSFATPNSTSCDDGDDVGVACCEFISRLDSRWESAIRE